MTNKQRRRVRARSTSILRDRGGYVVPGIARVEAFPDRTVRAARMIAERIAGEVDYLVVCRLFGVPGIEDLRHVKGRGFGFNGKAASRRRAA